MAAKNSRTVCEYTNERNERTDEKHVGEKQTSKGNIMNYKRMNLSFQVNLYSC